jgi:signal transduction histidine kinase
MEVTKGQKQFPELEGASVPSPEGTLPISQGFSHGPLHRSRLFLILTGALAGYLLLHLYSMVVHGLLHLPLELPLAQGGWAWLRALVSPAMLGMGAAYAVFGALVGWLAYLALERQARLERLRAEEQARAAALEASRTLLITLSHYVLNANTVIGGYAHRLSHGLQGKPAEDLQHILEESHRIDALFQALRSLASLPSVEYAAGSGARILDVAALVERNVAERESLRD